MSTSSSRSTPLEASASTPRDAAPSSRPPVALPLYGFSSAPTRSASLGRGPNTSGSWAPLQSTDLPPPSSGIPRHGMTTPTELVVLTYNVFQSSDLYHPVQRTHALLATIRSLCSSATAGQSLYTADIICLQEVSPAFEAMLQRERCLQRQWSMTSLRSAQAAFGKPLPQSPSTGGKRKSGPHDDRNEWDDGVMMLVRKTLLEAYASSKRDAVVHAVPFTESRQYKGLLIFDILGVSGQTIARVATAHFDSLPENASYRLSSFSQSLRHLLLPPSSTEALIIVAADFNHSSYAELEQLVAPRGPFVDVELAQATSAVPFAESSGPHGLYEEEDHISEDLLDDTTQVRPLDPFRSFPTFGHLFPFIPLPPSRHHPPWRGRGRGRGGRPPTRSLPRRKPRRTDLVLASPGAQVVGVERIGAETVKWGKGPRKGEQVREDEGMGGKLYASDHEGVMVAFRLART